MVCVLCMVGFVGMSGVPSVLQLCSFPVGYCVHGMDWIFGMCVTIGACLVCPCVVCGGCPAWGMV